MVDVDRRNHAQFRLDHVGGVKPAAHARFQYDALNASRLKDEVGHRSQCFEVRWMAVQTSVSNHARGDFVHTVKRRAELLRRDCCAIHANPLGRLHQVRRRVKACTNTGSAERAFNEGASGSLPVGSRDMDEAQASLW